MKAYAIITVEVEVHLSQPWCDTATVSEINTAARRDAVNAVRKKLHHVDSGVSGTGAEFKVLDTPRVRTVIVQEEKS